MKYLIIYIIISSKGLQIKINIFSMLYNNTHYKYSYDTISTIPRVIPLTSSS